MQNFTPICATISEIYLSGAAQKKTQRHRKYYRIRHNAYYRLSDIIINVTYVTNRYVFLVSLTQLSTDMSRFRQPTKLHFALFGNSGILRNLHISSYEIFNISWYQSNDPEWTLYVIADNVIADNSVRAARVQTPTFLWTNVTLVCVLSDIKSGCNYIFLCMCLDTDISPQVPPIGMKFRMMVHMCPGCVLLLLGYPQGAPKSQILTTNISKTVSRSVTRQMGRNIGSTKTFQKSIAWDGSPQWSPL